MTQKGGGGGQANYHSKFYKKLKPCTDVNLAHSFSPAGLSSDIS